MSNAEALLIQEERHFDQVDIPLALSSLAGQSCIASLGMVLSQQLYQCSIACQNSSLVDSPKGTVLVAN